MTELKDRFAFADQIDRKDLWDEARRRAATPETPGRPVDWPPGVASRVAVGALAFAVFAAAVVFAWDLAHPDRRSAPNPRPSPGATETFDLSTFPPGWTRLPDPPEVRSVAAEAWTGSELLVWGGYEYTGYSDEDPESSGYRFDPASGTWSDMPASPLHGRTQSASAWTGRELLIWGGWNGGFREEPFFDDGAAFDPTLGTWRMLPPAPIEPRTPLSVWTGEELIVWGSQERDRRYVDGAAYDPRADSWRRIADAPIELTDATAVWTGDVMVVFGAALHGGNHAETPTAIGASYDPEADSWTRIADSDLSPQASTAVWDGSRVIAWDYENRSAAYDPGTDTWQPLPKIDIWTGECSPIAVGLDGAVFGDYCDIQVLYTGAQAGWADVSRRPTPQDVIVPIAAGPVAFVLEHDRRAEERRMFVYRPPAAAQEGTGNVLDPRPFLPRSELVGREYFMPVVFPDGSRATLVFPDELGLEELGVQPDVSYAFRGRFQGPIVFLHEQDASIERFVVQDEGSTLINSSVGGLELWRARDEAFVNALDTPPERRYVVRLDLRSWTVLIPIEMPPDSEVADRAGLAALVASSLGLRETATGFPIAEATGDLELLWGPEYAGAPRLTFGDSMPEPIAHARLDTPITLSSLDRRCLTEPRESEGFGSACLGAGTIFMTVYADRDFVSGVVDGLRVEDFRPA